MRLPALLTPLLLSVLVAPAGTLAAESKPAAPSLGLVEVGPREPSPPACCTLPSRFGARHEVAAVASPAGVTVKPTDQGRRVLIDGEPFAEYLTNTGHQPAVWPIVGPGGIEMTRSWPLGVRKPNEKVDHPHHESLWFSHGGVNGHDFWHNRGDDPKRPRIVHQEFLRQGTTAGGAAVIETRNDWTADGETVLEDRRNLVFGVLDGEAGSPRYLDFTIRLVASSGDATFTDTKEGTFGVRIPGAMKLDAGLGGRAFNSNGEQGEDAWGRVASWVAYDGPLLVADGGQPNPTGGIAILYHPDSGRPECRWHVRSYGLFAANPFGVVDFPEGGDTPRPFELAAGKTLTLRFRVVFYEDRSQADTIQQWHRQFAATPLTSL